MPFVSIGVLLPGQMEHFSTSWTPPPHLQDVPFGILVVAENGRVALDRMAAFRPTLILLDLMMPVMDGFEFVMEMRRLNASNSIPIVVVTAKDVTEEDRRRLNGDVVGLIQKGGLDRQSLMAQLHEQLAAANISAHKP